jgi:hypothetical protein
MASEREKVIAIVSCGGRTILQGTGEIAIDSIAILITDGIKFPVPPFVGSLEQALPLPVALPLQLCDAYGCETVTWNVAT